MPLWFDWDTRKAQANKKKHQISFEEAATTFGDPLSLTIPDPSLSKKEDRYITLGTSINKHLLVVVHVDLNDHIRIISARKATRKERSQYQEG